MTWLCSTFASLLSHRCVLVSYFENGSMDRADFNYVRFDSLLSSLLWYSQPCGSHSPKCRVCFLASPHSAACAHIFGFGRPWNVRHASWVSEWSWFSNFIILLFMDSSRVRIRRETLGSQWSLHVNIFIVCFDVSLHVDQRSQLLQRPLSSFDPLRIRWEYRGSCN